jgi:hypothetical protein
MKTTTDVQQQSKPQRNWRYYLGAFLFVLSNLLWLIALIVVPALGLSSSVSTLLFGLSIAGGPDLLTLAAVALMGKDNIVHLMSQLGRFIKWGTQWDDVSHGRYRFGLALWIGSMLVTLGLFYLFPDSFRNGNQPGWGFYVTIGADILFIISVLVMGAPFWAKFAALFRYDIQIQEK